MNSINEVTVSNNSSGLNLYDYWIGDPPNSIGTGYIQTWGNYCWQHQCYNCHNHTTVITYPGTPEKIYMYQIFCPKEKCGTTNWVELNKVTPCTKCKSKLKAVTEKIDFEIPVTP